MSFGLSNAPSIFQAAMNHIFSHVSRKFVLVFLDDIFIYSSSWAEHLHHLEVVLSILKQHSFYAKLAKCEFGRTSLTYLGHVISSHGVSVDPEKIVAIVDWPLPKSLRELRRFLGLAGYYQHFVTKYASIAVLLT